MLNTVYREIFKVGNLKFGVLVFLRNTGQDYQKFKPRKAFKQYTSRDGISLSYVLPTFLVLDYSMISGTYIKEHKMFIPLGQIVKLETFLRKTVNIVEDKEGKIYYWDADHGNRLAMYNLSGEDIRNLIVRETGFSGNHVLQSIPTIVTDYQDNTYEGASIYIDRQENEIKLAYDELRALWFIIVKTDFVTFSQTLVNSLNLWANQNITKRLDIESTSSADYHQKSDINRSMEVLEQPTVSLGKNVFANLITKPGGNGA